MNVQTKLHVVCEKDLQVYVDKINQHAIFSANWTNSS